jgi:hypothetical protein
MRSERGRRALAHVLGVALAAALVAPAAVAADVVERVLAVVDGRPLLLSEVRVLGRVRGLDPAAALEAMIDEGLMYREAARVPQAAVSEDEEGRAYESLVGKDPGLATAMPEGSLRRVARRQATIVKYVAFRFRPQIRVDDADVLRAFEAEYAGKPDAPPLESVAAQLGEELASRALDQRIESWVKELRSAASIRYVR